MRILPEQMQAVWDSGQFIGPNRPFARVTIQYPTLLLSFGDPNFASAAFGQHRIPLELPNVKSVEWDRSLGSDTAECTVVFYNTAPLPLGETPGIDGDWTHGYYTYNHGATSWSSRWDHDVNKWQQMLMPDRYLRTYEGYGFDPAIAPEKDPHLLQTGFWLIDDVEYSTDGLITVKARDLARLLIEQICFPPVLSPSKYPMDWTATHDVEKPPVTTTTGTTFRPTLSHDSGVVWFGKNAAIHGHRPSHAFDSSTTSYWLSVGNAQPRAGYSYEYVEGKTNGKTISAVTFRTWGGPYRCYLSLKVKGKWTGAKKIPYDPNHKASHPNGSNITYSQVMTAKREATNVFKLAQPVAGVDAVRLTFTDLTNSGIGPYKYRAGVRDFQVSTTQTSTVPGGVETEGDYDDYSEVVKYILACGGFWWPRVPSRNARFTYTDGTRESLIPVEDDPFLKKGRVWGDIEMTGTKAYTDDKGNVGILTADLFDKKPLMDAINYIREIVGFNFFIDEHGAAVFRIPNYFVVGNWLSNPSGIDTRRTAVIPEIDERQTILGMRSTISSRNIRDMVFVGDELGEYGAVSVAFNTWHKLGDPEPTGMRRVGIWTDSNFKDAEECQRMADFIVLRETATYRTNKTTIAAHPGIQIDDQVRIYERVSEEGNLHYVTSIHSSNDLEEGRWTYDLSTHWLGDDPDGTWIIRPDYLSAVTRDFLDAVSQRTRQAQEDAENGP